MKYILDFDRTLFDADALLADFRKDQVDLTALTAATLAPYTMADYLYPDVLDFLGRKNPQDVYILTALSVKYGERILEYQTAKVEQEPLLGLIKEVVYTEKDKGEPARKITTQFTQPETVVFVDDLISNCLAVKASLPRAKCFLMVREPGEVGDICSQRGIPIVHTMAEVEAAMGDN